MKVFLMMLLFLVGYDLGKHDALKEAEKNGRGEFVNGEFKWFAVDRVEPKEVTVPLEVWR